MTLPPRKVAVRGLARLAGWLFTAWGSLLCLKGLWDLFLGQPEANFFSPEPWLFVTRDQWRRFAGFELSYGAFSLLMALALFRWSQHLPEWQSSNSR